MVTKQIFDEEGNTIVKTFETFSFSPPFFFIDIFQTKELTPILNIISPPFNLSTIKDYGIILYGIELKKKDCWAKRQKYMFYLRHEDIPAEKDSKEIKNLPANHYLEIDTANRKLRLLGTCIHPNKNSTEWLYF